eukprot:GHVP01002959.1.p1 GENE.GHVP01002959.1~~GHVP01002959.1.p1  ORF type:complete len:295 (+),score=42.79 GHVP01002959.1:1472-2356(+)
MYRTFYCVMVATAVASSSYLSNAGLGSIGKKGSIMHASFNTQASSEAELFASVAEQLGYSFEINFDESLSQNIMEVEFYKPYDEISILPQKYQIPRCKKEARRILEPHAFPYILDFVPFISSNHFSDFLEESKTSNPLIIIIVDETKPSHIKEQNSLLMALHERAKHLTKPFPKIIRISKDYSPKPFVQRFLSILGVSQNNKKALFLKNDSIEYLPLKSTEDSGFNRAQDYFLYKSSFNYKRDKFELLFDSKLQDTILTTPIKKNSRYKFMSIVSYPSNILFPSKAEFLFFTPW